jgi:hypothetical protein
MSIFSVFALVLESINISQYGYSYTTLHRNKFVGNFDINEYRHNQANDAEGSHTRQIVMSPLELGSKNRCAGGPAVI